MIKGPFSVQRQGFSNFCFGQAWVVLSQVGDVAVTLHWPGVGALAKDTKSPQVSFSSGAGGVLSGENQSWKLPPCPWST